MKNNITNLEIKNFKSIKDVKMDCKRINVFIGEPNVGKSNILEALSLFDAPASDYQLPVLKDFIRYEKLSNLFYDQDKKNVVEVTTNIGEAKLRAQKDSRDYYEIFLGSKEIVDLFFNDSKLNFYSIESIFNNRINTNVLNLKLSTDGAIKPFILPFGESEKAEIIHRTKGYQGDSAIPIKRYIFKSIAKHDNGFSIHLTQPFGDNLYAMLEVNPKLFEEVSHFFNNFGLDLLMDTELNKLEVQKKIGTRVYKIPYSLAADTLQRIIFHLAAIETNDDAILLLEEPEAHSFPPYISMLAEKMIDSKNNQFFVATHSQYMLTEFIEKCSSDELSIFICTYEKYETKVRALSKKEIANISETGIDLFFNIPAFSK